MIFLVDLPAPLFCGGSIYIGRLLLA